MNKKEAKEFYRKIGKVWCPTLDDFVIFNKAGFKHLMRKGEKRRTLREQERRFLLLEHASGIVENPATQIAHTQREVMTSMKSHDMVIDVRSLADFWSLVESREDKTITIIIRQIPGKEKHFFSIFDEKIKNIKKPPDGG